MKNFFIRIAVIVIVLSVHICNATIAETIVIAENMYAIDETKKLVLVNQDVASINLQWPNQKTGIILNDFYTFSEEISTVQIGVAYQAVKSSVNYTIYFSQLPIIRIYNQGPIYDDPKVLAEFIMTETDQTTISSFVGIELRGNTSLWWDKHNYLIEFWTDAQGANTHDVSLLGMRSDDDWNLQSLYNEPLRIRSVSTNDLWMNFGSLYYQQIEPEAKPGIVMKYAELFLNGRYKGIYAVSERVDRKLLQIKKYDEDDDEIRGELYKGTEWANGTLFNYADDFDNQSAYWSGFEYEYPEELIDWYYLHDFVDFVVNSTNDEFYATYESKFDVQSAIDYYILMNVSVAVDNRGKNIFIARYDAGEPYFYVPWDLDGVFGIMWDGTNTSPNAGLLSNGLYDRMLCDCDPNGFNQRMKSRWLELRESEITHESIMNIFETNYNYLLTNGAYEREQIAWTTFSYGQSKLDYISQWTTIRLDYLDMRFAEPCVPAGIHAAADDNDFAMYPNPASDKVYITTNSGRNYYSVVVNDYSGKTVLQSAIHTNPAVLDVSVLQPGLYIVQLISDNGTAIRKLIVNR